MEITFYDKTGHPKIYLSTDHDNSFYTWDGILYDLNGYRVGSIREKCPYSVYSEYSKYSKYSRYSRYSRYSPYSRPSLSSSYTNIDLVDFISQDKA